MNKLISNQSKKMIKLEFLYMLKFPLSLIFILLGISLIELLPIIEEPFSSDYVITIIGSMLIYGIVVGAELPISVKLGVARCSYFKGQLILAFYAIFLLMGVMSLHHWITGYEYVLFWPHVNDFHLIFLMCMLMSITTYFLGFFISMIFLRFGWVIGVVFVLILTIPILPIIPITLIGWTLPSFGAFALIMLVVIVALFSGSYLLVRNLTVKVK